MPRLFTPRNVAIGGAAAGAVLYFWPKSKPIETFGTQNIANRMSAGGGTHTHTPAVATPRGKPDQTVSPQSNPTGIDTPHFVNNVADQKAHDQAGPKKALNQAVYGQDKGK
ncbi:hypothetical protein PRZ48_008110 [Zasmidium cellare]|uniref:Uncharacterized protein n=1 Tax=Zasmidium cellare TaxID=395010 RepID=A0ABR0EEJ7_ZASCE|nr:hypothetical protein PRZ48_008110 [Zasmidium cellare]